MRLLRDCLHDKTTKDRNHQVDRDVDDYFRCEVHPHVPDAHYWFDEEKGPGAEIPTRYFITLPTRKCREA